MKKSLQPIQHLLRHAHLLPLVEYVRYGLSVIRLSKDNRVFIKAHPEFRLPPKYLAYDAYTAPNWEYYHDSGEKMAQAIADLIKKYKLPLDGLKVLDWGCGPARIIRHLPDQLDPQSQVFGSDYNEQSIQWARLNIRLGNLQFSTNELKPPLAFGAKTFDFVYAMSVFTHLSEDNCLNWVRELGRVLKDDGLLLLTTQSDALVQFLLPHERKKYRNEGLCVRGKFQEGKKMFTSFHSPDFVKSRLLKDFVILEHVLPGGFGYFHDQDVWLAGKRSDPDHRVGLPLRGSRDL